MLDLLLYIFPVFRAICDYHVSKNLPLLLRIIQRTIFSHLRINQSATQQVSDASIQTSGNQREPSPVSKPHGLELFPVACFQRVVHRFLLNVMEHCHEKKMTSFCLFRYSDSFFKQGTVQIDRLLLVTFVLTVSPDFKSKGGVDHVSMVPSNSVSSFWQNNSVLWSMWMMRLGRTMIFFVWNSKNKSTFLPR